MEVEKGPWRVIVRVQESIRPDQRTDVHPSGLYTVSRLKAVLWHKMFGPWVTASARLVAQRGIKSLGRLLTTGAQTRLISAPVTSCVKARHRRTRRTVCAEIYGWRVQACAGLYTARTPEWFISGPCAGPHTPSEGDEWGTSDHDNCNCQGPYRFCYHVDCLPGSEITRDSNGLWDCPGGFSADDNVAENNKNDVDTSMLEESLLQILQGLSSRLFSRRGGVCLCDVSPVAYERATYGLRESNFTILTCNCCTDSARSTCVPRTVLASSVLTPHFPVDLLNDHVEHTCTLQVYKDDLTGDCQLVSKMPRKAQKKTTRQDPKKRAAEDTRAASDDEVNRRCTHLQRASTACTRQRSNRTEIVRCKHVQLTYHLRNVRCTQPLTARRVVQTTYVHLAQLCE
ncbi:mannose binding [Branchiostoma belcheri]|nr:mannose binding [Branchiostoma belcheri]